MNLKYKYIKTLFKTAVVLLIFTGCSFEDVIDPNGPSIDGVLNNATKGQLNELVVGVESSSRDGHGIESTASGTMARELYLFDADPRNTGDLLGKNGIGLDNNSFYSTVQWAGNYKAVANAYLLITAAENSDNITAAEFNGYSGFAKTIIGYELIQILKSYGQARIDVSDSENLGPILNFNDAIAEVIRLLNEANTELSSSEFAFDLSAGFAGFDGPSTFKEFNRAVIAMAYVYAGNGNSALTALNQSYFDLAGDLTVGPKHIFGLGGGDQSNDLFKIAGNNGDQIVVHNSWINEAEANDARVTAKAGLRSNPQSQDGLNGTHETRLYSSNTSPIDILRNEELILLYAEANILQGSFQDASDALDIIRNKSGNLPPSGATLTTAALTTELLKQRRYSLWAENHRMFDLRRYSLSTTLPIDRTGDRIFNVLPVPLSENQ